MLRFPDRFVMDEKANDIIERFMNRKIIDAMNGIIIVHSGADVPEVDFRDLAFAEFISQYFPELFPIREMNIIFWGLRELLMKEEKEVPTLIMEYVMNAIIEEQACIMEEADYSGIDRIPEREYCIAKMEEYLEEDSINAEEMIKKYECLDDYIEYYFWDVDFELLNVYSIEQVEALSENEELGLGDVGNIKSFMVPSDWME
ncbi:MAG: hypothetical protein R3Y24_09750 [Eubacteriales bacterium]